MKLITQITNGKIYINAMARHIFINEIIFIGLVVLCFMGDVMGEISDHISIIYWLLMAPLFFFGSIILEKEQSIRLKKPIKNYLRFSLVLWVSAFFSVLLTLFLWHSGVVLAKSVGLIIHIILAQTLFITGFILGLRFYLIGLFLFIMAALTIAMEGTVGISLVLSMPIILIGLYVKKNIYPRLKRDYQ